MAGLTTPVTVTGGLTPETALIRNADGSAIASPVYTDCVYDSVSGKWLCRADAPNGTYAAGAQQFRLKGSSPAVTAVSTNAATVSGGGTTPVALDAPTGLAVTPMSGSNGASWNPATGATGYRLQRALVSGGVTGTYQNVYEGTDTSYNDTAVQPGSIYRYRVLTLGNGTTTSNSGYSTPVQVTAAGGTVTGVKEQYGGDSRVANTRGSSGQSFQEVATAKLGRSALASPLQFGYPGITPGNFNAQHAAQLKAGYVSGTNNCVYLVLGTNGISSDGPGLAATKSDLQALFTNLLNAPGYAVQVHWQPEPNRQDYYKTSTFNADRLNLNAFVKSLAATTPGLYYVQAFEDEPAFYAENAYLARTHTQDTPSEPVAIAGASATDNKNISYDGIHLIDQGNQALGALIVAPYLANFYGLAPVTGTAPLVLADDTTNILAFQHILGLSSIEVLLPNASAYVPAQSMYNLGGGVVAAGAYKARLIAKPGRLASGVASSPAFTADLAFTDVVYRQPLADTGMRQDSDRLTAIGSQPDWTYNAFPLAHVDTSRGPVRLRVRNSLARAGNFIVATYLAPPAPSDNYYGNFSAQYFGDYATRAVGILAGTPPFTFGPASPVTPTDYDIVYMPDAIYYYGIGENSWFAKKDLTTSLLYVVLHGYQAGSEIPTIQVAGAGWVTN